MYSLFDLLIHVARILTGESVILRQREPVDIGARGTMMKDFSGRPVIDVSPSLVRDDWLPTFLHECAHVKLHLHELRRVDVDQPPLSREIVTYTTPRDIAAKERREAEARELAVCWLAFAKRHAIDRPNVSDLENRLWALATYEEPGVKK